MAENYILLERVELSASASSVTFANIPQSGYTDLKIVASVRSNRPSATWDNLQIRLNGSTTSYSARYLLGNGSSASSGTLTTLYGGDIPAVNATSQTFSNAEYYFPNYLSNAYKSVSLDSVAENNATATNQFLTAGLWSNTAAINSIEMFSGNAENFVQYSTFSLYGLAAVGTTPVDIKAYGGDSAYSDGTYWYHIFRTSGTFTARQALTCDYLVVAGGGGGGSADGVNDAAAGGGGAGGYRTGSSLSVPAATYTITVGAGGAGSSVRTSPGTSGGNSQFSTISSTGGGGGGSGGSNNGLAGGSGGGSRGYSGTGGSGNAGSYSPVEGYAGGTATTTKDSGSGGGGSSAAGNQASTTSFGGTGGAGTASSITGTSITYAGGGGGGSYNTNNTASGGSGGGGTGGGGSNPGGTNPTNGTANLGGGGGGGYANANYAGSDGANGGSGIVIIRYAV